MHLRDDTKSWLVIGWYTPDYEPLAEKFAANLREHNIPHHLLARPKLAKGWNTKQKPSVVLDAMQLYPDKTIVLMDVDCVVGGDISPVTQIDSDMGLAIKARDDGRERAIIKVSSRVVVFRPTAAAKQFALEWQRLCNEDFSKSNTDEGALLWAFIRLGGIATSHLSGIYGGQYTEGAKSGAIIWHISAHDPHRFRSWKGIMKSFERRFLRTGRTKKTLADRLAA